MEVCYLQSRIVPRKKYIILIKICISLSALYKIMSKQIGAFCMFAVFVSLFLLISAFEIEKGVISVN